MKLKCILPITAMFLVFTMGGCNKNNSPIFSSEMSPKNLSSDSLSDVNTLEAVNLGIAGDFAILSKAGITDVFKSTITGDIGSSPITGAAILVSCVEVTGTIYSADAAGPLPCSVTNPTRLTTAVSSMEAAYTDGAGRVNPDFLNLGAGNIGGDTLKAGLYKWTTALLIPTDILISGGPNDVWIFQVSGPLTVSSAVKMTLTGGAQAKNIFWVIASSVTIGTTSHFEGNILGKTNVTLQTGASINGRILSQTAVNLQMNSVSLNVVEVPVIILPTITSTDPVNDAAGIDINKKVSVNFSEVMDPLTINASTFKLMQGTTEVAGVVTYSGSTATFTTSAALLYSISYTATITSGAKNLAGNALSANTVFSFTTMAEPPVANMATVNLGVAGNFAILSKTGITDVYKSSITGNIGTSPITGAAILVSCAEVVGTVFSVDAAGPLPCTVRNASMLTTAVSDMETAYTDAAGRANPDFVELGAGNLGGKTLAPGLYKWSSAVVIPTDVTISGGPNDVWIFQISGLLTMSSAVKITLAGGAQAKNIFWVIASKVTLGTTSHFEGNILGQTSINMLTGSTINGSLLAQTAVTLQMNTVNKP